MKRFKKRKIKNQNKKKKNERVLPFIKINYDFIFPMGQSFITLKDDKDKAQINYAIRNKLPIFILVRKESHGVYKIGSICEIFQTVYLNNGDMKLIVTGIELGEFKKSIIVDNTNMAEVKSVVLERKNDDAEIEEKTKFLKVQLKNYFEINDSIPLEVREHLINSTEVEDLIDAILSNIKFPFDKKIEISQETILVKKLELTIKYFQAAIEISNLDKTIKNNVQKSITESQKKAFLYRQAQEIDKLLGNENEDINEIQDLIDSKKLPKAVKSKAQKELNRLNKMQPMNPEANVIQIYLETLLELPWNKKSKTNTDIKKAKEILDKQHFGLEKPKELILDFIAITKLKKNLNGHILCFVGPPGTGKTSLARSIAQALNRKYIKISLGGVRDVAEIRGHRKTYIGALPGKIIQAFSKAKTSNPLILLDEIDKTSGDINGDLSSALLEVLDPEQNTNFQDHYLEVPYDLSETFFVATANSLENIPTPLRDRMEIVQIPSYTNLEKIKIAEDFIIPKQLKENGLDKFDINITNEAITEIIENYTMEAGVRKLEQSIRTVIRKITRNLIEEYDKKIPKDFKIKILKSDLEKYLTDKTHKEDSHFLNPSVGMANGLAWTQYGGTMLPVEVSIFEGKEDLILTGNLGNVMKESAKTALSFIKANSKILKINLDKLNNKTIHIHVPEGAIPKDGPSAGITICTALVSAMKNKKMSKPFAMTGEITLTGRILPIGGLKEKSLAAYRNKIKEIIIPTANIEDLEKLPKEIKKSIKFYNFDNINDALKLIFK